MYGYVFCSKIQTRRWVAFSCALVTVVTQ